jgi:hypothetical protein|tara:strand:- start:444 stop:830 length:387 start_codon:yes stop_codon:yes gene_type:complete
MNKIDRAQLIGSLIFTFSSLFGGIVILIGYVPTVIWALWFLVLLFSFLFFGWYSWLIVKDAYFNKEVPDYRGLSEEDKMKLARMEANLNTVKTAKPGPKKMKARNYKKTEKRLRKLQKEGRINSRKKK